MTDPVSVSRPYPSPVPAELSRADEFVEFACLTFHPDDGARRRRRAERLAADQRLSQESFLAAVVLGDVAAVQRALAEDRGRATRPDGPRHWVPLLYLTFGRVLAGDAVEVARLLLAAGADPHSHVLFHDRYRWSAVTGAIGEGESGPVAAPPHPQARALVELLLDAGADPNDSQGLYNTHFRRDNGWLELFLSRGLGPEQTGNWTADDPTRMLDYLLGQAVKQGFLDRVALLLAHGASASGKDHYDKRTHLDNAQRAGHSAIAALLVRHGAPPLPIEAGDDVGALLAAAEHGRLPAVRRLLDLGMPIDSTNAQGVTALHLAASNGHRLVVDELLARGASMDLRDHVHGGTALGRVAWASRSWPTPERDEVRRVLAERSTDVFGVVYAGAAGRLATLLAADSSRATARRPDGRSPLHVLAEGEVPEFAPLIELLLRHGADLEARNDKGQTPLEVATSAQADEVAEALVRRGARTAPK